MYGDIINEEDLRGLPSPWNDFDVSVVLVSIFECEIGIRAVCAGYAGVG